MSQFALSLPVETTFSEDNFFVSDCNREAYEWVKSWPRWPSYALIIYGEPGAGKTHLANIWMNHSKATPCHDAASLAGHALLENIEQSNDERALFHLLNQCRENNFSLLITSAKPPGKLPFTLPDLTSRLAALPSVSIAPPDDAVLAAALRKQFADRQLKVEEDVIAYVVARMERSFTQANAVVMALDAQALKEQKNITVPFARRILGY